MTYMEKSLKIKKDIKLKYLLNLHLTDNLIDNDSIVFEILRYLVNQSNSSDLDLENIKFTSKTLKYIFGEKISEDSFKNFVINSIKDNIKSDKILPKGKSMYMSKKIIYEYYE